MCPSHALCVWLVCSVVAATAKTHSWHSRPAGRPVVVIPLPFTFTRYQQVKDRERLQTLISELDDLAVEVDPAVLLPEKKLRVRLWSPLALVGPLY